MCSFANFIGPFLLIIVQKCKHKSKSDLRHIIFERSMPVNLKKGPLSITYGVLILSTIEDRDQSERPLSLSNIPGCLILVGILVISFKNLEVFSVKSRFIRNNPVSVNHIA